MNIVYLTLPMALILGGAFVYAFVKVALSGQYDDLETPAHRMLFDDESKKQEVEPTTDLDNGGRESARPENLESQDRPRKEAKQ